MGSGSALAACGRRLRARRERSETEAHDLAVPEPGLGLAVQIGPIQVAACLKPPGDPLPRDQFVGQVHPDPGRKLFLHELTYLLGTPAAARPGERARRPTFAK